MYDKSDPMRKKMRLAGWNQHEYDTVEEAREYLNKWLGVQGPVKADFGPSGSRTITIRKDK